MIGRRRCVNIREREKNFMRSHILWKILRWVTIKSSSRDKECLQAVIVVVTFCAALALVSPHHSISVCSFSLHLCTRFIHSERGIHAYMDIYLLKSSVHKSQYAVADGYISKELSTVRRIAKSVCERHSWKLKDSTEKEGGKSPAQD